MTCASASTPLLGFRAKRRRGHTIGVEYSEAGGVGWGWVGWVEGHIVHCVCDTEVSDTGIRRVGVLFCEKPY